jgi:glycosyltransferase involved in cell wall biosynthesis
MMPRASPRSEPEPPRSKPSRRTGYGRYLLVRAVYLATDVLLLFPLLLITALSRLARRQVHVGLGPVPSINSRYHKQCLQRFGYRAETFVYHTWYLTSDFDIPFQKYLPRALCPYVAYVFCLFRYQCLYTYFTGGPLGPTTLLARCEPYLLRLAGIKTVIMPFGADVHELTRAKNLALIDAYSKDYPEFRHSRTRTAALIDAWTHCANHIISGCDWVDFMYYWDTLMLTHFAIDTDVLVPARTEIAADAQQRPLRLLHAPNHRHLKGTRHIIEAVDDLRAHGVAIELSIVESLPNSQMSDRIRAADVVVDQLIVGWYAMFALESMTLGKPVVCYVRQDLRDLYIGAGLLEAGELPLIEASVATIKETLEQIAALPRSSLHEIGLRSRAFVEKHHSIEAVGQVFDRINRELGLRPDAVLKRQNPV